MPHFVYDRKSHKAYYEPASEANISKESNQETLLKLLANSEMATLLKTLAKNL